MKRTPLFILIALLFVLFVAACNMTGGSEPAALADATPGVVEVTPEGTPADEVTHGGPIVDYVSLVDALRAAGATVQPVESLQQPFFEPTAQVVEVNGERVQIFEFADEAAAVAAAETVAPSGSSVGTTMLTWEDTPHFYRIDRLIALYVGSDQAVLELLQQVLGAPFAGG